MGGGGGDAALGGWGAPSFGALADDAAAAEDDIEGVDLGNCVECARNAARKLLKNGRCVGIVANASRPAAY